MFEEHGALDAGELERLVRHEEPWIAAGPGIPEDEPSTATLDEEAMGNDYRQRLSEAELEEMLTGA